jgi:hypothetical protein
MMMDEKKMMMIMMMVRMDSTMIRMVQWITRPA